LPRGKGIRRVGRPLIRWLDSLNKTSELSKLETARKRCWKGISGEASLRQAREDSVAFNASCSFGIEFAISALVSSQLPNILVQPNIN
jgi:hypothetical protein